MLVPGHLTYHGKLHLGINPNLGPTFLDTLSCRKILWCGRVPQSTVSGTVVQQTHLGSLLRVTFKIASSLTTHC